MKKIIALALVVIMLLALASCSKIKDAIEDAKDQIEENINGNEDELVDEGEQPDEQPGGEEDLPDNEFVQKVEFEEDGDVMRWSYGNVEYVYVLDGDAVVRYLTVIDYENEDTAKMMEGTYRLAMESSDDSGVKALSREGSVVTIEFTEDNFAMRTRAEVEEAFESIKALQDSSDN